MPPASACLGGGCRALLGGAAMRMDHGAPGDAPADRLRKHSGRGRLLPGYHAVAVETRYFFAAKKLERTSAISLMR